MAKTVRNLLRISMMIRSLGPLNNYTITKRFIQTSAKCGTRYNKDSLVSPRLHLMSQSPQDSSQQMSLQHVFKTSEKLDDIYQIIQKNSTKITASDAVVALEALFNVDKNNPCKSDLIYKRSEFLTLCEILKKNIRRLNTNEQITMLKTLLYFNVPTSSVIVQVVLQMIRRFVNQLSLQQITFIEFLLSKCQKTPLVEALAIALPIVFESNVSLKLDRENIQSIAAALKYLSRRSENSEVFDVIISAMRNCKQSMSPSLAISVLWSLCDLKCFPVGLPGMINCVQNTLAQNIASVDRQDVRKMMSLLADKLRHREKHFYHEGFADACASIAISEDWGFTDAVYILEKLNQMDHMQISLLDYIAAKCFEEPTILETCPPTNIATIVAGFSNADYKPVFWDVIKKSVTSERVLDARTMNYPLSKLAVHLTSLDCYFPKLLEKIFANHSCGAFKAERGRVLLLYQAVKTLYPQYDGPFPTQEIVNFFSPVFKSSEYDFPMIDSLECALGGRRYVLTNVRTKLGHHVGNTRVLRYFRKDLAVDESSLEWIFRRDHVLVMRKGGFPIAINNDDKTEGEVPIVMMEDLQPPQDGQVILILYVPAYAYSVNSQRMKGVWSLQIKSLEALSGYTVIPIQSPMWTSLPESERIPYLMQAIRLKCDETFISANS